MAHNGKLFFDFTVPDPPAGKHWSVSDLKKMHDAVEAAIDKKDKWNYGDCERNRWRDLWNIPSDHKEMIKFCNKKLRRISNNLKAKEKPSQPIAYCYSGDSRICYHPHALYLGRDEWTVWAKGKEIPILITLSYNTKCFPIKKSKSAPKHAI